MLDMQLVVPNAVAMAVRTLMATCITNFQASFFMAVCLLAFGLEG